MIIKSQKNVDFYHFFFNVGCNFGPIKANFVENLASSDTHTVTLIYKLR